MRRLAAALANPSPRTRWWLLAALLLVLVCVSSGIGIRNGFTYDDVYIVQKNGTVHTLQGWWQVFVRPYWPKAYGSDGYRPLTMLAFIVEWAIGGGSAWVFHAMNIALYGAITLTVFWIAGMVLPLTAAWIVAALFAVHPVHVEAVANVIGRGELMAALGVCLAVYAAVVKDSIAWSALALAGGLLSKENAAVAPGLIAWAWIVGLSRPPRARMLAYVGSWLAIVAVYVGLRATVLHPYERLHAIAPVFLGESFLAGRLTAIAALGDVLRLLVLPITLRVDYSPAERTIVHSLLDGRFVLGFACLALWAGLLVLAWRRERRVEAFGLGWIAIAFLPVANLLFSTGVLMAERTLYLPSVGVALALGAALSRLPSDRLRPVLAVLVLAGAIRSAVRVPVWRDDVSVTVSILEDSPKSYRGHARVAAVYQSHRQPERALAELRTAMRTYDRDPTLFIAGADAAFTLGQPRLADSMLVRAEQLCFRCAGSYRTQALAARSRGDSAVADSLMARAQ